MWDELHKIWKHQFCYIPYYTSWSYRWYKKKIGINDDEIEWVIFDEKDYIENRFNGKMLMPSFVYQAQYKYGFCYINTKQIYISTAAIMTSNVGDFKRKIPQIAHIHEGKSVFLINVILDELAHIKTGKDHGNKEYDTTLEKYYKAYYKKSDLF